MKVKRVVIFLLLLALVGGGVYAAKYFYDLSTYRKAISDITIGEIDLAQIPDGVYTGHSEAKWVAATVVVTVKGQRITDIQLDHRHDQGIDAEVIPSRVIEAQSLQVDIVSGATSSCKVILEAIENAFKEAAN